MQTEDRVAALLAQMTLAEKLGQLQQFTGDSPEHRDWVRRGMVGSIINVTSSRSKSPAAEANALQEIAVKETRLGIPMIFGRDVIHGYRTVMPIPLGQAATFDMELVEEGAAIAAREASAYGVHWTFAPMVDVSRDPRWGRIAESGGEDPLLNARLGAAMVRGFQGEDMSAPDRVAACAKHYVGYGAAEGGRDYNTTYIPEGLLRDVYLPPFKACVDAGVATFMSAFNDLNGVPTSGNAFTMRQVLKGEWNFDGFVVSDWNAIIELIKHGFCADKREAALAGLTAGVDMEMLSTCYVENAQALLDAGLLSMEQIDDAVTRILRIKERVGLFDNPYLTDERTSVVLAAPHLDAAKRAALESCVLLKNDGALPLPAGLRSLAVIGPMADNPKEQMGSWTMDGNANDTVTPLTALREALAGRCDVQFAPGVPDCRSTDTAGFAEAVRVASACDAVLLIVGEDAGYSGEAHSRAYLTLPGSQDKLVEVIAACGKPVTMVIMAGRPLALEELVSKAQAILFAWHPGTMGGPAIADLLLGTAAPSGKLPATFPRTVGQVPVYYAHKSSGRPPRAGDHVPPIGTPLDPSDFAGTYMDSSHMPLYPFGFGLSYTTFAYSELTLSTDTLRMGESLRATVTVENTGSVAADEVVQLYTRDLFGSTTRPVKEMQDFRRVTLAPGERQQVTFTLNTDQLAFHNPALQRVVEPGAFHLMVGGNSEEVLLAEFTVVE